MKKKEVLDNIVEASDQLYTTGKWIIIWIFKSLFV